MLAKVFRPHLVCLYISAVYLTLPSRHFGVDALHYNLLAFISAHDFQRMFSDISVPPHALWHVLAAGLVRLVGAESPLHSLYVLQVFNIGTALASLFVFVTLVRSFADELTTVCAVTALAFGHACLRYFLSIEVYALNNLVLALVYWFVYRSCGRELRPIRLVGLCFLTTLALTAHLSNVVLMPAIGLLLVTLGPDRRWLRLGIFGGLSGALLAGLVAWLSIGSSMTAGSALRYLLRYAADRDLHVGSSVLQNIVAFCGSLCSAAWGPWGPAFGMVLVSILVFLIRNRRWIWGQPFARFLAFHLCLSAAFFSQWDASNIEHKIALLQTLILLAAYVWAGTPIGAAFGPRVFAAALAAVFVVVGLLHGILPFRDARTDPLYALASRIHEASDAEKVVLIAQTSQTAGRSAVMPSQTYFGQQVRLLQVGESEFTTKLRRYRDEGFDVVGLEADAVQPFEGTAAP